MAQRAVPAGIAPGGRLIFAAPVVLDGGDARRFSRHAPETRPMTVRVGVDVGGTFTDLVGIRPGEPPLAVKVRSDPEDPARAILSGTLLLLERMGATGADVAFFGHGTTVVTNMILERKGARLAVLTTEGFRDVLELARQSRPHVYDYRVRRPAPLAARRDRIEVAERLDATGAVLVPLGAGALAAAVAALADRAPEAVAVCFLHAYANPAHEAAAREAIRAALPAAFVTCSHEVAPEMREFERFSTAALNAFVGPRAARYFDRLARGLAEAGVPAPPYTITSNGGLVDEATARRLPVQTALSGPAAGVMGIGRILAAHGAGNLVTFDVGGTSTDVAVLEGSAPRYVTSRTVGGHPVLSPMIDMEVVGAGGGSLARIGPDGALAVGPDSAGADPGPASYGRGGTRATVTDAAVVLGRIGADARLGGTLVLDGAAARRAIEADIAAPLGVSVEEAAAGVLDVAVANMARTIRSAVTARGLDPERFTLAAYGGAGPLFACDVAATLGMRGVLIPVSPGTLCARALLAGDLSRHFAVTAVRRLAPDSLPALEADFAAMETEGRAWLAAEGFAEDAMRFDRALAARYAGQGFEITVPVRPGEDAAAMRAAFDAAHEREQGFALPDRPAEAVTLRLVARAAPEAAAEAPPASGDEHAARGTRTVIFAAAPVVAAVFSREALAPGADVVGPAVLEETTATTVVPPAWRARVLTDGTLAITPAGRA